MAFGNEPTIRFCGIRDGQVTRKTDAGTDTFDYVEGTLEGVALAERDFGHQPTEMLVVTLRDGEGLIRLSTSAHGGVGRSIVLSLAAMDRPGLVKIRPYLNPRGYNSVAIFADDRVLRWAEPLADKKDDGNGPDESDRRDQVRRLVKTVSDRIASWKKPDPEADYTAPRADVSF